MCLIVFALNSHADFPLLMAANRDEFHDRPTRAAGFWPEAPQLLAGRDEQSGGSWLGITRSGRLAAITNVRGSVTPAHARSRGLLVRDFLLGEHTPEVFLDQCRQQRTQYAGFNLLLGCLPGPLWVYNSRDDDIATLRDGDHGLSNDRIDSPWPKAERSRQRLRALCDAGEAPERLLDLLRDNAPAEDQLLPDTGIGLAQERLLSPPFIRSANYGTRASTVLAVNRRGDVCFLEQSFDANGPQGRLQTFRFALGT